MKKAEFKTLIDLGEQTFIAPDYAQTRLKNGNGSKAYVARIVGSSERYGLKREFVKPDWSLAIGKGKSGTLGFQGIHPGLYEFRQFCVNDKSYNWHQNGFFVVTENGVAEIDSETAADVAKELDSTEWYEVELTFDDVGQANEPIDAPENAEDNSQFESI